MDRICSSSTIADPLSGNPAWKGTTGEDTPLADKGRSLQPDPSIAQAAHLDQQPANAVLSHRETLFQSVITAMAEGVIVMDRFGSFFSCNPSAERILGLPADQIMGRTSHDPRWGAIHEDGSPFLAETHPIMVTARTGLPQTNVIMGIRKPSGELTWLSINTQPLYYAGESSPVGSVASFADITENKKAQEEVQNLAQRLQALSRRLLETQEEQARHIARELHDEIGQILTGLKLTLESMSTVSQAEQQDKLRDAGTMIQELIAGVRGLAMGLRPTMLDDLGLLPALQWHFQRYTSQTSVQVEFSHRGLDDRFPSQIETGAFRIIQEALTNVARHAAVPCVSVRTWVEDGLLHIQIEDRGVGFDPAVVLTNAGSNGLSGMRERAVLLGGRLSVESNSGIGTHLMAELPIGAATKGASHDLDSLSG